MNDNASLSSAVQTGPGEMRNLSGVQNLCLHINHFALLLPYQVECRECALTWRQNDMQNEPLIRKSVSQSSASPKQSISHDCSLSPEQKSWVKCAVLLISDKCAAQPWHPAHFSKCQSRYWSGDMSKKKKNIHIMPCYWQIAVIKGNITWKDV